MSHRLGLKRGGQLAHGVCMIDVHIRPGHPAALAHSTRLLGFRGQEHGASQLRHWGNCSWFLTDVAFIDLQTIEISNRTRSWLHDLHDRVLLFKSRSDTSLLLKLIPNMSIPCFRLRYWPCKDNSHTCHLLLNGTACNLGSAATVSEKGKDHID